MRGQSHYCLVNLSLYSWKYSSRYSSPPTPPCLHTLLHFYLLLSLLSTPVNLFITMDLKKGLRADPWCSPTSTCNLSVPPTTHFISHAALIQLLYDSNILFCTLLSTLLYTFPKNTKTQCSTFWPSVYFYICTLNANIASVLSVVLFLGKKIALWLTNHILRGYANTMFGRSPWSPDQEQ